jgi:hypothetical protein
MTELSPVFWLPESWVPKNHQIQLQTVDHNRAFTFEKGKWPRFDFIRFVPWKIEGHSECCIHKTYSRHMVSTCSWLSNIYFVETYQDAQEDTISPWNRPHWIPCFWMNCHPSPPHKPVRVALPVQPCWRWPCEDMKCTYDLKVEYGWFFVSSAL